MPFNAQVLYNTYLSTNRAMLHQPGINIRSINREHRADAVLNVRMLDEQLELDCAMWYGTLTLGTQWKRELLTRIFQTLHYGGLMFRSGSKWNVWYNSNLPLASALSHGGRVLIQLPRSNRDHRFFIWLWSHALYNRLAATHGVIPNAHPEFLPMGRRKHLTEAGKTSHGHHFGVNIGLGGVGNVNPFSGNTIYEDGEHGHLYLFYRQPTLQRNGAILVGVEDSAPLDRFGHSHQRRGLYAMGQSGHKHKTGASGTFSATGGRKWDDNARVNPTRAMPGSKVDAMFVDLATVIPPNPSRYVPGDIMRAPQFQPDWLGYPGAAPPVGAPVAPVFAEIPTMAQWKIIGKDVRNHMVGTLHRDTPKTKYAWQIEYAIRDYNANPSAQTAKAILNCCYTWLKSFPGPNRTIVDLIRRAIVKAGV